MFQLKTRRRSSIPSLENSIEQTEKTHNLRKITRRILLIIIGLLLATFAFIIASIVLLSARKTHKNIMIINPVIDGKVNSFLFASLFIDPRAESSLAMARISSELKLTPLPQTLEADQTLHRKRRAQASLQTGVLIDEVWEVGQIPSELTKWFF
jgi:hypothetical protein